MMKVLIDMNLPSRWVDVFERLGWDAVHWSNVGDRGAADREIMDWARANGYVIFTHDLDFGSMLAVTRAEGPSVIQLRAQDVVPERIESTVVRTMQQYTSQIREGALIVVDESSSRVRILPLAQ